MRADKGKDRQRHESRQREGQTETWEQTEFKDRDMGAERGKDRDMGADRGMNRLKQESRQRYVQTETTDETKAV